MEYGTHFLTTPTPVGIVEGKEGLSKVTTFTELLPFTLRALLKGYGCTDDMLNRLENTSSILSLNLSPIDFFVTSNPHCFAACTTTSSRSITISNQVLVEQHEIIDLVESLPGSFKSPGTYQRIASVDASKNSLDQRSLNYTPPVFETALRYLTLSKHTYIAGDAHIEKYFMVLYIPTYIK
ncbi:MAG: hypothetical protein AB9856_14700 [Cellulosilyticaceae bacterium]